MEGATAAVRDLTIWRAGDLDVRGDIVGRGINDRGILTLQRVAIADAARVAIHGLDTSTAESVVVECVADDGGIRNESTATFVLSTVRDVSGGARVIGGGEDVPRAGSIGPRAT